MNKTVWILETDANYYVSDSLDRLYDKAREIVENWATVVEEGDVEYVKNDLKETYEDDEVNGFYSDAGEIYCYSVEWV